MITIEGLVFLCLSLFAGHMASGGFIGDYFNVDPQFMLKWHLTPMGFLFDFFGIVVFLLSTGFAWRGWSQKTKQKYFIGASGIFTAVMILFLLISRITYGNPSGAHDGVVQTEIAAGMILDGKNPYVESYQGTLFEKFHPPQFGQTINPILLHYPYPPLVPLATVPIVALARLLHVFPDGRILTMGLYLFVALLLLRQLHTTQNRIWASMVLFANPLLLMYPFGGFNDILFLTPLLGALLLAKRQHWLWAGVMLGLAVAAKQTAVLAVPLWCLLLWQQYRRQLISLRILRGSLLLSFGVVLLFYGPFLVWNFSAFIDDTIRFVSGVIPYTYPIGGDSVWQFQVLSGTVPNGWTTMSTLPYVIGTATLGTLVTGWWLVRRPTLEQWLSSFIVLTFLVSVVNRYFYENYVASLLLLGFSIIILRWSASEDETIALPAGSR